ncbi:MAG TPA: hypothetical protein DEP01_06570 [Aminobacterium sp.]|jgi:hypothetical protein|uniref:DUF6448 family protein n=1 Tax=Aminobacterium TaxID=81466 RepID=UPI0004674696|nr:MULTISPECIES: DUF6448 family protein [Aminobacterium]HCA41161.1 hypothetical protein [Aminobacterium sp.]
MSISLVVIIGVGVVTTLLLKTRRVEAHCDTLDGPVVQAARKALADGNVLHALKWVRHDDEEEVRKAFELARKVSTLGMDAKEVAERFFFETLVRIHRASEGEPYEGLKSSDTVPPVIRLADEALDTGDVSQLSTRMPDHVKRAIEEKFHRAWELKGHAENSLEAGREFVEAYITFIHYVEGIHALTMGVHPHKHLR